jgi:hypothetical protein
VIYATVIADRARRRAAVDEKSRKRIGEIWNRNWINIFDGRKLPSSLNDMKNGVAMNAYTTISSRKTTDSTLGRLFRALCREAFRAIELVGASYRNGPLTPL